MSPEVVANLRDLLDKTTDARARRWLVPSDSPDVILLPDKEGDEWDGSVIAVLQRDDFELVEEDVARLIVAAVNTLPELLDEFEGAL